MNVLTPPDGWTLTYFGRVTSRNRSDLYNITVSRDNADLVVLVYEELTPRGDMRLVVSGIEIRSRSEPPHYRANSFTLGSVTGKTRNEAWDKLFRTLYAM